MDAMVKPWHDDKARRSASRFVTCHGSLGPRYAFTFRPCGS